MATLEGGVKNPAVTERSLYMVDNCTHCSASLAKIHIRIYNCYDFAWKQSVVLGLISMPECVCWLSGQTSHQQVVLTGQTEANHISDQNIVAVYLSV